MGSASSTLALAGITSTEATGYAKARKRAAKELFAAHKAMLAANAAYANSLTAAGAALLVFCEGTAAFKGSSLGESLAASMPFNGDVSGARSVATGHALTSASTSSAPAVTELAVAQLPPLPPLPPHAVAVQHQQAPHQQLQQYSSGSEHYEYSVQEVSEVHGSHPSHEPHQQEKTNSQQQQQQQQQQLQMAANEPPPAVPTISSPAPSSVPFPASLSRKNMQPPPPSAPPPPSPPPLTPQGQIYPPPLPPPQNYAYPPPPPPPHMSEAYSSSSSQHPTSHPPPPSYPPPPFYSSPNSYHPSAPYQTESPTYHVSYPHSSQLTGPPPNFDASPSSSSLHSSPSLATNRAHSMPLPSGPQAAGTNGSLTAVGKSSSDVSLAHAAGSRASPAGQLVAGNGAGNQLVSYVPGRAGGGGVVWGDSKLAELARGLNDLFKDAAEKFQPLNEMLRVGGAIDKVATPPLSAAAARKEDGRLEGVGETLQKLVNWERYLKKEIKQMESTRLELQRQRGKLDRKSRKANKAPSNVSAQAKVQGVQYKVNVNETNLASLAQSVSVISNAIELFKTELLLPQVASILPSLVTTWAHLAEVHDKQRQLAAAIRQHQAPEVTRSAAFESASQHKSFGRSASSVMTGESIPSQLGIEIGNGTSKAQHDATKKLSEAFHKWHEALSEANQAQRKWATCLISWVRKTLSVPVGYPRPQAQYPPQVASWAAPPVPPPPAVATTGEGPLVVLCNDWMRTLDKLPESEMKDAVNVFCGWMKEAYDLQSQEIKQLKKVEDLQKVLHKADMKLEAAVQKEREIQLALGGPVVSGGKEMEKETRAKETKAKTLAAEIVALKAHADDARNKVNVERVALERFIADGRVAVVSGVQQGLPVIFQNVTKLSTIAAQAYGMLQHQHAPWLPMAST